jgi:hypothetical protein
MPAHGPASPIKGAQNADKGFDHAFDHSLDSHHLRHPDHRLYL